MQRQVNPQKPSRYLSYIVRCWQSLVFTLGKRKRFGDLACKDPVPTSGVDGLNTPLSVAVHPVTQVILVAGYGDSALTAFERDRATGHPVYLGMEKDGVGGVYGLGGAYAIAVSPDGRHVYVAGTTDQALVVFGRGISRLYLPLNLHNFHN